MDNTDCESENPVNISDSESESNYDEDDEATLIAPPQVEDTKNCLKTRHVLGILGFFGFANVYAMRVNLSVAIVAMVNSTQPVPSSNTTFDQCPVPNITNSTEPVRPGEFNWDEQTQSIVLGSFFYGYVLTQMPGGRLSEIFGSKRVYGMGVLITSVFTLLTPIAARINFTLFIIVRILEGMGEGVTFPSMHAMIARWIPPLERSTFAAYVYAGANLGTIISMPLSGWLCSLDLDGGWPLSFYLFGVLGIVWFFLWIFLVHDTPSTHPRIDPQEKAYIIACVGPQVVDRSPIPWRKMMKCVPLWAILVTQCGNSWAFYTQLQELPTYMGQILHFNIQANAILSAIPYLTSWIAGILFSLLADWLLSKGYLSLTMSYKIFNSIATIIPSLGILGVAYVGCDKLAVQLLLSITGAFGGAIFAGNQMNHIALSPKYAGTMYGFTNTAGNMCGFLAPYVIGLIIEGRETLGQWRMVFYLAAGLSIGGNLFYIIFGSARERSWARGVRRTSAIN
ncbi:unnamed protein product [Phyllotreta striolata]|uniref:Major facilitator superfamily (MFS) profile domain-containing protein n=1 Tax=Phyllotreta striolata TaxID=444603 RepID=A0A9N9XPU3_PHYSR|nr:unnamed protein product [Phyllotreta striolata]